MEKFKKYKGRIVPSRLGMTKTDSISVLVKGILDGKNICRIGINCSTIKCSNCVCGSNKTMPPIEWFIEKGYFTKAEVLDASLTIT